MTSICGVMDLLVQLMICYICWTQGSSSQLRKFECTISLDDYGNSVLNFKLKTEGLDLSCQDSEHRLSVTSDQIDYPRHLVKSDSFYLERACNEIVLQFINGIEDDIVSTEATDNYLSDVDLEAKVN